MITFKEWQERFFPRMPELLKRLEKSGYSLEEMDRITREIVPENPTEISEDKTS